MFTIKLFILYINQKRKEKEKEVEVEEQQQDEKNSILIRRKKN